MAALSELSEAVLHRAHAAHRVGEWKVGHGWDCSCGHHIPTRRELYRHSRDVGMAALDEALVEAVELLDRCLNSDAPTREAHGFLSRFPKPRQATISTVDRSGPSE